MKKQICALLILLVIFSACLGGFAMAEEAAPGLDHITDTAGFLTAEQTQRLEDLASRLSEEGKVAIYAVTMEDYTEYPGEDIFDCAKQLYEYFHLGYGPNRDGILLLMSLKERDYTLVFYGDYAHYCFNDHNLSLVENAFLDDFAGDDWESGFEDYLNVIGDILLTGAANGLSTDQTERVCQGLSFPENSYWYGVDENWTPPEPTAEPEPEPTAEPVPEPTPQRLEGKLDYVTDSAGILDPQQKLALEKRAAEISQSLNFYVYIVTVPDYKSYSRGDVFTCATELYTYFDLGSGANRDGVLLLMSMRERDYALISHGFYGNYCFGDHNKDLIEEAFLDNFRRNDWSGGFSDYLSVSEDILRTAAAHQLTLEKEDQSFPGQAYSGNTYRYGVTGKLPVGVRLLIALGVPSGAALAVCSGFKSQMKTARERTTAEDYVVPGSAVLRVREDRFINRTETRTLIQSESSSSGGGGRSSHSSGGGGGFTGHSGKF